MLEISKQAENFMAQNPLDDNGKKLQAALLLYPYILNGDISHGYAAKLLGTNRLSLISLYESIGIPYIQISKEELAEEVALFDKLKEIE